MYDRCGANCLMMVFGPSVVLGASAASPFRLNVPAWICTPVSTVAVCMFIPCIPFAYLTFLQSC